MLASEFGILTVLRASSTGRTLICIVHCKACLGEIEQYNYNVSLLALLWCFRNLGVKMGAMLTSPCLSWPTTLIPDGSSRPCPSGPKGTTPPYTSGPNFQVVLIQVTPIVHFDPLHVLPL